MLLRGALLCRGAPSSGRPHRRTGRAGLAKEAGTRSQVPMWGPCFGRTGSVTGRIQRLAEMGCRRRPVAVDRHPTPAERLATVTPYLSQ